MIHRTCSLTKQKTSPTFPDLLKRDFTAKAQNQHAGSFTSLYSGQQSPQSMGR